MANIQYNVRLIGADRVGENMPWMVKCYRNAFEVGIELWSNEYVVGHSDGRETSHSLYVEHEESSLYQSGEKYPDVDAWLERARGLVHAMNEADELADVAGCEPRYPTGIEVRPGIWRVESSILDFRRIRDRPDRIVDTGTWEMRLTGPKGESVPVASGDWNVLIQSDDAFERHSHTGFEDARDAIEAAKEKAWGMIARIRKDEAGEAREDKPA